MADRDKAVRTEIALARAIMINARPRPALPTTYPSRRNRMIPRIVRMLGVNTPAKVPSFPAGNPEPVVRFAASAISVFSISLIQDNIIVGRTSLR